MPARRTVAFAAIVAVPLAVSSTGAAYAHSQPTHKQKVATVNSQLKDLAVAEETYFTDHPGHYTTNIDKLRAEGYVASKHTTVHVVWINGSTSYCLAGRYKGAGATTKRSYDSANGGLKSAHFSCAAHEPKH